MDLPQGTRSAKGSLIPTDQYSRHVGEVLRDVRRRRGFTLREVGECSAGEFKPTSLAGYERGERSISLMRFCRLAEFYRAPPERLLAEIVRRAQGRPETVVDVSKLGASEAREARALAAFVDEVQALRGERAPEMRLRIGDLQVLSAALGRSEADVITSIHDVLADRGRSSDQSITIPDPETTAPIR